MEVDTAEAGIANEIVVDWARRKKIKVLRACILKAFAHGLCSDQGDPGE
jgi:nanoRNase/pAp phosphatase (c-di-AMP/oligoRNAs hydrolase)